MFLLDDRRPDLTGATGIPSLPFYNRAIQWLLAGTLGSFSASCVVGSRYKHPLGQVAGCVGSTCVVYAIYHAYRLARHDQLREEMQTEEITAKLLVEFAYKNAHLSPIQAAMASYCCQDGDLEYVLTCPLQVGLGSHWGLLSCLWSQYESDSSSSTLRHDPSCR